MRSNGLTFNRLSRWCLSLCLLVLLVQTASASIGDRLPDFKECLQLCQVENCEREPVSLPIHLRLLLWDCHSECDYTCQHVITERRLARDPPMLQPIVQYHGKWPFHRVLGLQELFSVIFSLFNFLAHQHGMAKVREYIPASYPLRKYYLGFGYFGLASWIFSMLFHSRDFPLTEKLDYYAAGASVLYGLYLAVIRIYRLDRSRSLALWTVCCLGLYLAHVSYLTFWWWDYTYNMVANVVIGLISNFLWTRFSISRYRKCNKPWAIWPAMIVAWVVAAMSLELLDFPPIGGYIDAHSLWHLGTVIPTVWWYKFLIVDAHDDMAGRRLKT